MDPGVIYRWASWLRLSSMIQGHLRMRRASPTFGAAKAVNLDSKNIFIYCNKNILFILNFVIVYIGQTLFYLQIINSFF